MPLSDDESKEPAAGLALAVAAEALYLANLLLLPGIAFLALLALYLKHRRLDTPPLANCHLQQTLRASLWAGSLLILVSALVLILGGFGSTATWVVLILYVTCCHSSLVLLGIIGLAKALAGKPYVYPLIGKPCK